MNINLCREFQAKPLCEHSSKTRQERFMFSPIDEEYFKNNRAYHCKLVNCSQVAILTGMTYGAVACSFEKYGIYPKYYRKRAYLYLMKDIVKWSKLSDHRFTVPVGFFNTPEFVYVGREMYKTARLRHEYRSKYFASIFEMLSEYGIPVQTITFASSAIPFLEEPFLTAAGKLFKEYNKLARSKRHPKKKIILCTTEENRRSVAALVEKYNKKFPGFLIAIDQQHLINLRERDNKLRLSRHS